MTAKMKILFANDPPKRPIKTLDDVVDDWIYRFGANGKSRHMRDEVEDWCALAKNWRTAVKRATDSRRPNGKMHNHQCKVPQIVRDEFKKIIFDHTGCFDGLDFDGMYDFLNAIKPKGIGPVTLYDVAVRLAAYLEKPITSLYLHAGVRIGWCLITGKRSPAQIRIYHCNLPRELQRIPTNEVEDMLCCYRDVFSQLRIRAEGYES